MKVEAPTIHRYFILNGVMAIAMILGGVSACSKVKPDNTLEASIAPESITFMLGELPVFLPETIQGSGGPYEHVVATVGEATAFTLRMYDPLQRSVLSHVLMMDLNTTTGNLSCDDPVFEPVLQTRVYAALPSPIEVPAGHEIAITQCEFTPASAIAQALPLTFKIQASSVVEGGGLNTVSSLEEEQHIFVMPSANTAPVISPNPTHTVSNALTSVNIPLNAATDADVGDVLTYSLVSAPSVGSLSGCIGIGGATVTDLDCVYTLAMNQPAGAVMFSYKANDGRSDSNIAVVTLNVTAPLPPTAPVIGANQTFTAILGQNLAFTLNAATDVNNDPLQYQVVTNVSAGTLSQCMNLGGSQSADDRTCVYAPSAAGTYFFTYRVTDGTFFSNNATVTINVLNNANALPSGYVKDILVHNGVYYVGTDNGFAFSSNQGSTWTTRNTSHGLGSNNIHELFTDGQKVYVATANGLAISNNLNCDTFTNHLLPVSSTAVQTVFAHAGVLYAGTSGLGLGISEDAGQTWSIKTASNSGLASGHIQDVYVTSERVYAATSQGLSISLDGGETFTTVDPSLFPSPNTYVVEENSGRLYVGTLQGLSIEDDVTNGIDTFTTAAANKAVSDVSVVGDGIWASTSGGIFYSLDAGASWTNTLPLKSVWAIWSIDNTSVLASMSFALWGSSNAGQTFTKIAE